ncbi:MAG: PAS domain-containing protein [Verrucomicrobia bacterium]|nr:PAS domain-containing protein [Verrucomicrobiota bacterium]
MATFWDKLIERFERLDPERRERYLADLARERGFLQSVFDTIEDALIVLDARRRIVFINRAARHLLGIAAGDPVNRPLLKYIADGRLLDLFGREAQDAMESRVEAQGAFNTEIEVRHPRPMVLRVTVLPLRGTGGSPSLGTVIVMHDATAERKQRLAAFQSEKLGALATLAAGVAHEIGNPLNSLAIHMQLLEREIARLKPGRQRNELAARVETSRQEIERLDGIIRQFLGAVRPSKLDYRPVQINELLEGLLEFNYYEIAAQQIGIEKHYDPAIPRVLMDEAQIKQACLNIIKNAVQAMPKGGLLTVTTTRERDEIVVRFADSGVGMTEEQIGRIFDPFYTTKDRGSGLGLMIVHKIITDHNGRIEVESEPGRGTRVTVVLPVVETRRRLIEDATSKAPPFEPEVSERPKRKNP